MNLLAKNVSEQIESLENEISSIKAIAYAKAKQCRDLFTKINSKN